MEGAGHLDDLWSRRYLAAREAWPHLLRIGPDEFRAFVEERWPSGADDTVAFADLLLTCGCVRRRPEAFVVFEQTYRSEIDGISKRLGRLAPPLEDARQLVRQRLFAGDSPRIAAFRGRGSLKNWVRVVALRTLLNQRRQTHGDEQSIESDADVDRLLPVADSPELQLMKDRYAAELRAVLRECIAELTAKERTLLRMAFVEGANVDAIGALYAVHRATAARWVQTALHALKNRVHRRLRERLGLQMDELESALKLIASGFDTSLSRYLA